MIIPFLTLDNICISSVSHTPWMRILSSLIFEVLKNSNDTIVNRTRDLPVCSAVPQEFVIKPERINTSSWIRSVLFLGWLLQGEVLYATLKAIEPSGIYRLKTLVSGTDTWFKNKQRSGLLTSSNRNCFFQWHRSSGTADWVYKQSRRLREDWRQWGGGSCHGAKSVTSQSVLVTNIRLLRNPKLHHRVYKSSHMGPDPEPDQSSPLSHAISSLFILILSHHLPYRSSPKNLFSPHKQTLSLFVTFSSTPCWFPRISLTAYLKLQSNGYKASARFRLFRVENSWQIFAHTYCTIFSLNSPCIFIILDIHQQNAQIINKVQLAPYHSQTLHMFQLSTIHHQEFFQ
jgi:hypothetical protein